MYYIKVKGGSVVSEQMTLPDSYKFEDGRSCGNFSLLDDYTIKKEGFLLLQEDYPVLDTRVSYHEFSHYEVLDNSVIAHYIVKDKDINDIKAVRLQELLNKKNELLYSGIRYNNKLFSTDREALQNIAVSAFSASVIGADWTSDWQLKDSSFVTLNQADIMGLNAAINARVVDLRAQVKAVYAAVAEMETVLDVVNLQINLI